MENVSFRNTVLPLSDRLFRLALRITMNRAEAEDAVQDTLLRVWEQRGEWGQIRNLEAYAIQVCRNRALDMLKRAGRNAKSIDEIDSLQLRALNSELITLNSQLSTPSPQLSLEANEQLSLARTLMDRLPELQRTIMLLRDIEGKSYQEIAEALDISEQQVKVYLHRARTKVKKGLEIRD